MLSKIKKEYIIGGGYLIFMIVFYAIGATKARFLDFVAIVLLSLFYAGMIYVIDKIRNG